jgi:D-tyrosyl-tRNA(Tyr) deacylase
VRVGGAEVGAIGPGLAVLVGVAEGDDETRADALADKVLHLRIFENDSGKFDRSVLDVGGGVLALSQFTLLADASRGRRPGFTAAAPPERAEPLYRRFVDRLSRSGLAVAEGVFRAHMELELVNDGPVTLILDTEGGA